MGTRTVIPGRASSSRPSTAPAQARRAGRTSDHVRIRVVGPAKVGATRTAEPRTGRGEGVSTSFPPKRNRRGRVLALRAAGRTTPSISLPPHPLVARRSGRGSGGPEPLRPSAGGRDRPPHRPRRGCHLEKSTRPRAGCRHATQRGDGRRGLTHEQGNGATSWFMTAGLRSWLAAALGQHQRWPGAGQGAQSGLACPCGDLRRWPTAARRPLVRVGATLGRKHRVDDVERRAKRDEAHPQSAPDGGDGQLLAIRRRVELPEKGHEVKSHRILGQEVDGAPLLLARSRGPPQGGPGRTRVGLPIRRDVLAPPRSTGVEQGDALLERRVEDTAGRRKALVPLALAQEGEQVKRGRVQRSGRGRRGRVGRQH